MKNNVIESILGGVVLAIGAGVLWYAYNSGTTAAIPSGYKVEALFDRIDGLLVGSDVRVGGIKVGSVAKLSLDPETYMAKAELMVDPKIRLPQDSTAAVVSESLLGGKYLSVVPGGSDTYLKAGEQITHTQSSVNLESLIGQMIFSKSDDDKKTTTAASSGSTAGDSPMPSS